MNGRDAEATSYCTVGYVPAARRTNRLKVLGSEKEIEIPFLKAILGTLRPTYYDPSINELNMCLHGKPQLISL
jgi:hypothetical protein